MTQNKLYNFISVGIATVWIVNGLFCKILILVPRHQQIVAHILGDTYSLPITIFIGFMEVALAIWILSKCKSRLNAMFQIVIVLTMNTLEFFLVPELLLWGKLNFLFAFLFVSVVYYNEFYLNKKITQLI